MLTSLLSLIAILLAAFGLGRPLARAFRAGDSDPLAFAVWSLSLGLVAAAMLLTGLGLAGCLFRPVIGVLTLAASFWGLAEIIRARAEEKEPVPDGPAVLDRAPCGPPPRWLLTSCLFAAALACGAALVAALAPPTAGDALCYHLELPKIFLAEHAFVYLPYDDNCTFPLLVEMLFLWGLSLDGGVTAQLVHWSLGVLFCLSAVLLATPVVGRPWAWLAGALVALVPGVTNQMTAPLNDVALAMFTTLAITAWRQALAAEGRHAWFVISGLMWGAACGTKYVALVAAAAFATTWLWDLLRQPARRRELMLGAVAAAVLATSVCGVWYVRAAWFRGNPVYPFFDQYASGQGPEAMRPGKTPLAWQPLDFTGAPWQVTMHPERFGGRGHQLGAIFLIMLPGLLFCRRLRGLSPLLAMAGVYWLLWFALRQNLRFLLPAAPLLSAAAVWVWMELTRLPAAPRRLATAALLALVAFSAAISVKRAHDKFAVAIGRESRGDFLSRCEPTWQAAQLANRLLEPGDHILSQDYRGYYFHDHFTRESAFRRRTRYAKGIAAPGQLSRTLRGAGFTHLLLAEALDGKGLRYNRKLLKLVDQQMLLEQNLSPPQRSLRELARYDFRDSDGLRRYRFVVLR